MIKLNARQFLQETSGLSLTHTGMYFRLICLHQILGDEALINRQSLKRKLGIVTEEESQILEELLTGDGWRKMN